MNKGTNKKIRILLWKNKYRLFIMQVVFGFLAAYISVPVINKGFYLVIKLSGYSAITKENYLKILRTPGAAIYILIILALVMFMMLLNAVMMVVLLDGNCQKNRSGVAGYIRQVERHFVKYVFSSKIISIFYFIPITIAVYMPAIILLSYNNSVISFLINYIEKQTGRLLYWIMIIFLYILCIVFTVFRFPVVRWLILSDRSYKRSVKAAKPIFSMSIRRLKNYIKWNIGCFFMNVILYLVLIFVSIFVISIMSGRDSILIMFYEVYGGINAAITILVALICGCLNLGGIAELTKGYLAGYEKMQTELKKTSHITAVVTFLVVSVVAMFFCIQIILGGKELTYVSIGQTLVSAHRGESTYAPENTIPAIEKAIEDGADYVEIDVRLTADGQVILMHDADTKRTTNGNLVVKDSTYEELLTLDAGSWFSEEYADTKIPTLEEAIELCKGNIMMNIELKPSNNKGELEQAVAELITEYNMEGQCIVTSFNQKSILTVKNENPEIVTGYIYTFGYSNNIEYKAMDVLSISSRYLTRDVVTGAHKKGIIVAAWTVNDSREMRRMVAIGVDNIITDNTPLAKKMIYEKNKSGFADIWRYIASIYTN